MAEERTRLTVAKSINVARVLPSNNADISVLEYCGTQTLADVMAMDRILTMAQIYAIGADIGEALASFHTKGLVHGKVEAESISKRGNLWVLNSAMKPDSTTTSRQLDLFNLANIFKLLLARYLRSGKPLRGETAQFAELIKQMQKPDSGSTPSAAEVSKRCYELLKTPPKVALPSINQWSS